MREDFIGAVSQARITICGGREMMKEKYKKRIFVSGAVTVFLAVMLTGCQSEDGKKTSQAYYVISEELDIKKTADKAQEILENADPQSEGQSVEE